MSELNTRPEQEVVRGWNQDPIVSALPKTEVGASREANRNSWEAVIPLDLDVRPERARDQLREIVSVASVSKDGRLGEIDFRNLKIIVRGLVGADGMNLSGYSLGMERAGDFVPEIEPVEGPVEAGNAGNLRLIHEPTRKRVVLQVEGKPGAKYMYTDYQLRLEVSGTADEVQPQP